MQQRASTASCFKTANNSWQVLWSLQHISNYLVSHLFPLKSIFQSSYNHHLQSRYLSTYTCLAFFCLTLLKCNALKHWSPTLCLPTCSNAASDHICKLYICYKNCTIIEAVRYTTYYFAMCCL